MVDSAPGTPSPPGVVFRPCRADEEPARGLLAQLEGLLDAQYAGRDVRPGSVTTPDELAPPGGVLLVGRTDDGRAVAVGGLRGLSDGRGELKRLYVAPRARSRGVGRALLAALEGAARALGYTTLRLDAGPAQHHSRALFASAGYREIGRYNANHIADFFAEKDL